MQVKIKIAGTDRSDSVEISTVKIENVITSRIDICNLSIRKTGGFSIGDRDELIISNLAETVRYFGGYIVAIEPDVEGITPVFKCGAQDYSVLLDGVIVNEVFENKTDGEIYVSLFTKYLPEILTNLYVEGGLVNTRIVFNKITLTEAVNMLANKSGYDWYVDYFKNFHYFAATSNSAPFELSDAPDMVNSFPYSGFKYARDSTKIVNRVTVQGGTYLSDNSDFEGPGNAKTTEFLLPYKLKPPVGETQIFVYKNTGSDVSPVWTQKTVGVDNIDDPASFDVMYNYDEKLLKFKVAPSNLARAIKSTGRYEVPLIVRMGSIPSYDAYGRWIERKVVDKDIDNIDWAKAVGKSILAEWAFVKESGDLSEDRDGLIAGQRVKITNSLRGIAEYYLINKVTTSILGGTTCLYKIDYGEYNPDLVDMLIDFKSRAKPYQAATEEYLIELLQQSESIPISESTDLHSDTFPPDYDRWIAQPPTQGVGYHIRHEAVAVAEKSTNQTSHAKNNYLWDAADIKWNFFTWG